MQVSGIQRGELAPLCRVGVHLSAPAPPLLRPPEAGPPRLGRTVPGGAGRGGETTESDERSPGPSPSGAGDGGLAGADRKGWPSPRAELGRRDSTSLCRASALGPSRAGPARGPAPAPSGWPRPAPPPRGTLQLAPGELGRFGAVNTASSRLPPSISLSPGVWPPISQAGAPRPPAPWRVLGPWLQRD